MSTHLYRSRDDQMLAGVAGGLAELWDADPSLVRIVWALLVVLTGGIALVVYIVMAIVVPEEDDPRAWGIGAPMPGPGTAAADPNASTTAPDMAGAGPGFAAGASTATPPGPPSPVWPTSRYEQRQMRRAARHDARMERRAWRGQDGRSGALIIGVLFILVGAWYLVRQYLPEIDWDWFWPLALVGLGIVILYLAVRPHPDSSGPGGSPDGSAFSMSAGTWGS